KRARPRGGAGAGGGGDRRARGRRARPACRAAARPGPEAARANPARRMSQSRPFRRCADHAQRRSGEGIAMKETSGGIGRSFLPAAGAIAFAAACLAVDGARAANFIVVPTDLQFDATFVGETTVIEVTVMNV